MINKEKSVQELIIKSIRSKGFYAVNVNSGSLFKKTGKFVYKVELAPKGTPDILACIDGEFRGIEVKKSEAERKARIKIVDKYLSSNSETYKSHIPVLTQRKTGVMISEAGGKYVCTYSVEHFRNLGLLQKYLKNNFLT